MFQSLIGIIRYCDKPRLLIIAAKLLVSIPDRDYKVLRLKDVARLVGNKPVSIPDRDYKVLRPPIESRMSFRIINKFQSLIGIIRYCDTILVA